MATKYSPGSGGTTATRLGLTGGAWSFTGADGKRVSGTGRTSAGLPKYKDRSKLTSGRNQVFRSFGTAYTVDLHLMGLRTLIIDSYAGAALMQTLVPQVVRGAGTLVRDSALADSTFKNRTWDTRNSMVDDPVMKVENDDIIAEMGPTTFYAPFLEFGFHKNGEVLAFPFMIPALDKHTIDFINGMIDIVGIVAGDRPYVLRGEAAAVSGASRTITAARKYLYTWEKALGDVAVFTGSKFISPLRGGMLAAAKQLGDVQAIIKGASGARISTRIRGSVTGRGLGYTRTVSQNKSYSANIGGGGGVGGRVYNRAVGRATRPLAVGR